MSYRFGKHPPKIDYRTLRFENYLTAQLPPVNGPVDTFARVLQMLTGHTIPDLYPMDHNDTAGDCTIAGLAHTSTTYHGLIGQKSIMTADAVLKLYFKLTGGVDSGLNMLDVLTFWRKHTEAAEKILAFVSVNPKNHEHVAQAIEYFGVLYTGFQCQQNVIADFDAGRPWTPGTLTNDGHCVVTGACDSTGVTVLTWGRDQKGTWAWWDECVDECYAIVPKEGANPKFAPGFNLAQLEADLAAVAN